MVKICIKWGKEKFDNIDLDVNNDVKSFKAIIYSLTNVPIDKQKILFKGSIIKVKIFFKNAPSLIMKFTFRMMLTGLH